MFKYLQIIRKSYSNYLSFPLLFLEQVTFLSLIREITPIKNIILESNRECAKGVKPLIHESSPFSRKKFLSLWSIVKTTEWNGLIKIDN
jgi:hypothetical protein